MDTVVKRLYEALFLVDSARAASDWQGVNDAVSRVLERAEADVVSQEKWDDRVLAYEIQKKGRGTYILCYFNADPEKIVGIERDVQLSDEIMRVMILRGDHLTEEVMQEDTPALKQSKAAEEATAKAAEAAAEKAAAEKEKQEQAEQSSNEQNSQDADESPEDADVVEDEVKAEADSEQLDETEK